MCAWLLLLVVLACAQPGERTLLTEVELDMFSGRPNPTWTMAGEEGAEVWDRIASLPAAGTRQEPDHLGYRGFVLRRGTKQARVYKGLIWIYEGSTTRVLRDTSGVETTLIDAARARGFGDVASNDLRR
jgi:hypothetical protein